MLYFIIWAVFMVACIVALPVASMMDKRKMAAPESSLDDAAFSEDAFQEDSEGEAQADEAFGEADQFPAEEVAEAGEPVLDDFSAFDEEFK
jgi:hypothetical protein